MSFKLFEFLKQFKIGIFLLPLENKQLENDVIRK